MYENVPFYTCKRKCMAGREIYLIYNTGQRESLAPCWSLGYKNEDERDAFFFYQDTQGTFE